MSHSNDKQLKVTYRDNGKSEAEARRAFTNLMLFFTVDEKKHTNYRLSVKTVNPLTQKT